jgi:GNAT superfamily N-acetyltransferase
MHNRPPLLAVRLWAARDASAPDVDRIVEGSRLLAQQGHDIRPDEMRSWADRVVRTKHPKARYLVVPDGTGDVAGFSLLLANPNDFRPPVQWWLETLFVFPEHRGAGVASTLLRANEEVVLGAGGDRLSLHWSVTNADALPLYALKQYLPTGDLVLCKRLPSPRDLPGSTGRAG